MQEQIHDEDDEDDGDNEGLDDIVDGGVKEIIGGLHLPEFQTGRQRLGDILDHLVDFGINLCGIGTRCLIDDKHHPGVSVHP